MLEEAYQVWTWPAFMSKVIYFTMHFIQGCCYMVCYVRSMQLLGSLEVI